MKVNIAIERHLVVPVPFKKAAPLLDDLEGTIGRFPKLKKLSRISENCYRWDMQKIGLKAANISHEVIYAARYSIDKTKGLISWVPMPEHGNATIEGSFGVTGDARQTQLEFKVRGELRDLSIPLLYRPITPAFVQAQFTALVETFLQRTGEAIGGAPAAVSTQKQVSK